MSAFHGIGKRRWLNIVKDNEEYYKVLGLLGGLQIKDQLFDIILCMNSGPSNIQNSQKVFTFTFYFKLLIFA